MKSIWIAEDPMPTVNGTARYVEFLGFYRKNGNYVDSQKGLSGSNGVNKENTANFNTRAKKINWDLKQSGYTTSTKNGKTIYTYTLKYRVRLKNELNSEREGIFKENNNYLTNDTTKLSYQTITTTNGTTTVSPTKDIEFPIPKVKGYLVEFNFDKIDRGDFAVAGAEFILTHDTENCRSVYGKCNADGNRSVPIGPFKATSDLNGKVNFTKVPSGHQYILQETSAPSGYVSYGDKYTVKVAYDKITITDKDGNTVSGRLKVVNAKIYKLPKSGGPGTEVYTVIGVLAAAFGMSLLIYRRKIRGKRG